MPTIKYPIQLERHPNWPVEMRCAECGFAGWEWMGVTKLLLNSYAKSFKIQRCSKCGVGVMNTNGGALPLFILK